MWTRFRGAAALLLAATAPLLLASCRDEPTPRPTFATLFRAIPSELMNTSSPALADLNGDGVDDIVIGTGFDRLRPEAGRYVFSDEPEVPGIVLAVSGADGTLLWKAPHTGDAHTTPRFTDVNGDGVPDVVMGGREGALAAYSGAGGAVLWRVDPRAIAETAVPYNFFTPAVVRDVNGDGIDDLIVIYGGDDTRLPGDPRAEAYVVVISAADGAVLAAHATPDGAESYSAIVVYERAAGAWFVFGTGGETHGGAAYRAPVASLLDGSFATRVERLIEPGATKGVIAPATLVELTGDDEIDVVISTFDGRLIAVDGATRTPLWQHVTSGEEAYHPAAVVRISRSGRLGLLVSRGTGVFPRYTGSVHRIFDTADGALLYEYRNDMYPAGAPLGVDLTGDGIDEPFFFSVRYPMGHGSRIHILHGRSRTIIGHDLAANMSSTPVIADPRDTGTLELIGATWTLGAATEPPDWRDLESQVIRLDLGVRAPAFRAWAGYMGTRGDGLFAAR